MEEDIRKTKEMLSKKKILSFPLSWWSLINNVTLMVLLLIGHTPSVSSIFLAGVTIKSEPFVNVKDNVFSGFCVDLMDLIQDYSGLNYSLYLVNDNSYGPGHTYNGEVSGLIGDVYRKKADFAIADMTVTKLRSHYVNFTEPFLRFSFSALVRRSLAKNLETIDDLAIKSNLSIGTFLNGKTMLGMETVRGEIRNVRWLYKQILKNKSNLVMSIDEAMHKIYHEPYAFIQEEPKNLYYSSLDCSLKTLYDQNLYIPGEYAIAFHQDSPHIDSFNRAIKLIKYKGHLKRLIRKHFYNPQCQKGVASILTPKQYQLLLIQCFVINYIFWMFSY